MGTESKEKEPIKPRTPNLEDILNKGRDQFQEEWYKKRESSKLFGYY